jgi:hypothetical protein
MIRQITLRATENCFARCIHALVRQSGHTIGAHVQSDFRITSPPPNARYQIDPVLAPSQQMVELSAACGSDVGMVCERCTSAPERDGRFSQPPLRRMCAPSVAVNWPSKKLLSKP